MSLSMILIIVLIVLLLGGNLGVANFGAPLNGGLGLVVLILIILLVMGRI